MFEQLLLQATFTDSLNTLLLSITGLLTVAGGLIAGLVKLRAQGRQLSEYEQKLVKAGEFTQLVGQKGNESSAQINAFMKAVYNSLPQDVRDRAQKEVKPILDMSAERSNITIEQIRLFADILGIDVNQVEGIPRESAATLAKINRTVRESQSKVFEIP